MLLESVYSQGKKLQEFLDSQLRAANTLHFVRQQVTYFFSEHNHGRSGENPIVL
jgi:hypothetical protein